MPRQHQTRIGPILNDQAPFSPEMVQGVRPPARRIGGVRNAGLITAVIAVAAAVPFSSEMVLASRPERPRPIVYQRQGQQVGPKETIVTVVVGPEMVQGVRADRNRQRLGPRLEQPVSQTTHVPAPIGPEMLAGVTALTSRYLAPDTRGGIFGVPDVTPPAPFAFESVSVIAPSSPRLPGLLAVRLPQAPSQLTHVPAPFQSSMVQGVRPPDRRRSYPHFPRGLQALFNQPPIIPPVGDTNLNDDLNSMSRIVDRARQVDLVKRGDRGSARLSTFNQFTQAQELASATPQLLLNETDQGVDLKRWVIRAEGQRLELLKETDDRSIQTLLLALSRDGLFTLPGIAFDWTPVDASGAGLVFAFATGKYLRLGPFALLAAQVVYPATADVSPAVIGGFPLTVGAINQGLAVGYYSLAGAVPTFLIGQGTSLVSAFIAGAQQTNAQLSGMNVVLTGALYVP